MRKGWKRNTPGRGPQTSSVAVRSAWGLGAATLRHSLPLTRPRGWGKATEEETHPSLKTAAMKCSFFFNASVPFWVMLQLTPGSLLPGAVLIWSPAGPFPEVVLPLLQGQRPQWLSLGRGGSACLSASAALPPAAPWSSAENSLGRLPRIPLCTGRRRNRTLSGPRRMGRRGDGASVFRSPLHRLSSWGSPSAPVPVIRWLERWEG